MSTVTITARDLSRIMRAVAVHAHDETVPSINTVILTAAGRHLIATATDRYVLAALRVRVANDDDDQPTLSPDFEAWVPLPIMRQAAAWLKGSSRYNPTLTLSVDAGTLTIDTPALISGAGVSLTAYLRPPDRELLSGLHRILREAHEAPPASVGAACLDPRLLARFAAAQELGDPLVMWTRGASKPWAVAVGDNFRGVIQGKRFVGEVSGTTPADLDEVWCEAFAPALPKVVSV